MSDELTVNPSENPQFGDLIEKPPSPKTWQDQRLAQAEELLSLYRSGQMGEGEAFLKGMGVGGVAFELFQEIGRLTRELHDSIHAVMEDEQLVKLAHKEIPDATERLAHVIDMTEQAANTTLSAVEAGIPKVEHLQTQAQQLQAEWQRFRLRQMTFEEFKALVPHLSEFFNNAETDTQEINRHMTSIMMAQDFQDLTGQIIRRVIGLVRDVESKLVEIIRMSGTKIPEVRFSADTSTKAVGPATPSVDKAAVTNQDDVDDLLSSLGF